MTDFRGYVLANLIDFLQGIQGVFGFSNDDLITIYNNVSNFFFNFSPDWITIFVSFPFAFVIGVWRTLNDFTNSLPGDLTQIIAFVRYNILADIGAGQEAWFWLLDRGQEIARLVANGFEQIKALANTIVADWFASYYNALSTAQLIFDRYIHSIQQFFNDPFNYIWNLIGSSIQGLVNAALDALGLDWLRNDDLRNLLLSLFQSPLDFVGQWFALWLVNLIGDSANYFIPVINYLTFYRAIVFSFLSDPSGYILSAVRVKLYDLLHDWISVNF